MDFGIVFFPGNNFDHICAFDADLAGDLKTSRSTSGGFARLGDFGAVYCNSHLEKKNSTSTNQSETYAGTTLVKEAVWERVLLGNIKKPHSKPSSVYTDNDGVVKQSTKSVNHSSAKHYRISQAYLRSKVNDHSIIILPVDTSLNPADMFTKALPQEAFERHRYTIMGPQSPPH